MELHTLPKTTKKSKKRLGQGWGSGKGKTGGRGTKGQKARGSVRLGFEGGQLKLIKRLPLLRGRSRNKSFANKPLIVNLKYLNLLSKGDHVTLETLISKKIVRKDEAEAYGVKILGDGELSVSLTVEIPVSKRARVKIEKAGGTVVKQKPDVVSKQSK